MFLLSATWIKDSVLKLENTKLDERTKNIYLTSTLSVQDKKWVCNTCYSSTKEKKTPKLPVLHVNYLEFTFIY